ncbi:hypothetical protein [Primorskyibacter sp. S187A]|uniref:hypothetical protein n=1 Tax=Primorskyibacter sp. S187A TaxID=3415130 RepID=UPI003C7DBF20
MLSSIRPYSGAMPTVSSRVEASSGTPPAERSEAAAKQANAPTPAISGEAVSRALAIFAPSETQVMSRAENAMTASTRVEPEARQQALSKAQAGYAQLSDPTRSAQDTRL